MLEDTRAGSQESGGAIEVADSSEIAITGCQVLDPAHRGIDLSNTRNCRVADCTILDRRPAPTMRDAIRMHGRHDNNMIQQNLLGKGTRADLHIEE
jgi:parallel beta-helix repeat protein